ncbi:LexA family protein [Psychrobacillus sp. FSL K6-1267]|uniref:LexA family protein n=1 Tax=Psychrobacillus sp. FSL K6-1267 TaxID=2921543 RepID=UPI0030FC22F6
MTKRQREIYEYIKTFISEHHYSPTIREITKALGLKSSSTVHGHLETMRKKGYITYIDSFPRTLQITG